MLWLNGSLMLNARFTSSNLFNLEIFHFITPGSSGCWCISDRFEVLPTIDLSTRVRILGSSCRVFVSSRFSVIRCKNTQCMCSGTQKAKFNRPESTCHRIFDSLENMLPFLPHHFRYHFYDAVIRNDFSMPPIENSYVLDCRSLYRHTHTRITHSARIDALAAQHLRKQFF